MSATDTLDALAEIDEVLSRHYGSGRDGVYAQRAAFRACLQRLAPSTQFEQVMGAVTRVPPNSGLLEEGRILRGELEALRANIAAGRVASPRSEGSNAVHVAAKARTREDHRRRVLIALSELSKGRANATTTSTDLSQATGLPEADVRATFKMLHHDGLVIDMLGGQVMLMMPGVKMADKWALEQSRPKSTSSEAQMSGRSPVKVFVSHAASDLDRAICISPLSLSNFGY